METKRGKDSDVIWDEGGIFLRGHSKRDMFYMWAHGSESQLNERVKREKECENDMKCVYAVCTLEIFCYTKAMRLYLILSLNTQIFTFIRA